MSPLSKLKAIQSQQPSGRFLRVESVKDGRVIVSDTFDRLKWTVTSMEKDVTRRTLALVSIPFNVRISDIACDQVGGVGIPHPVEH